MRGWPACPALSFTGTTANSGGQIDLRRLGREGSWTFADGWDRDRVLRLAEVWTRWHLNDMRPGCEHQRSLWRRWTCGQPDCVHVFEAPVVLSPHTPNLSGEASVYCPVCGRRALHGSEQLPPWGERPIDPEKPLDTYGRHVPGSHSFTWNMLGWVSRREHPEGLLSHPCPVCGYRYGTAWLYEPLPAGIVDFVRALGVVLP